MRLSVSRVVMFPSGRPVSVGSRLKMSCARDVKSFTRSVRSRKIVAMSAELMKFWRSLLDSASSSILIFSSWLTVVSSSLTDWSSSLLVSSSSAAERSSSLIACSSSLPAFDSSACVSYCSTVTRSWSLTRTSSSSSCWTSGSAGLSSVSARSLAATAATDDS